MTLNEIVHTVISMNMVQNAYIDLDGTVKPHNFPKKGMWRFDGQVYYLPAKSNKAKEYER